MNFQLTKSDIYFSLIFFVMSLFVGSMDYQDYDDLSLLWMDHINYIVITSFTSYVLIFVIFARYFPTRRFVPLFVLGISFLLFMGIIEIQWYCWFRKCSGNLLSLNAIFLGFQLNIEAIGIFTTFLLGKKLYDAQVHFVKIEKEKKESELRFLKSQIDPHFLFNNLNTVDSLIDTNPDAAKKYINKLSQLYRYLIASKDHEVVTLDEELEFAENYMYLMESRYGKAYQFEIIKSIEDADDLLIPPGALQTLLENIIKHNQASATHPIKCTIHISSEGIEVSNNLKPKTTAVDSTGIGLKNLVSRYKLLTDNDIQIQSNNYFTVTLPILKQVA